MPSLHHHLDGLAVSRFAGGQSEADWPDIDLSLFEERRSPVPAFPLELLAQPWRDWVSDTAHSAGAPVDYVVQSLLAAVAALCGARCLPCLRRGAAGLPIAGRSTPLAA